MTGLLFDLGLIDHTETKGMSDEEMFRLARKKMDALRANLAASDADCPYCGLGAHEMNRCERGFPGCARADDLALHPQWSEIPMNKSRTYVNHALHNATITITKSQTAKIQATLALNKMIDMAKRDRRIPDDFLRALKDIRDLLI